MLPEIKLTITQNDKLIQTVTRAIENKQLVKSLEEFQVEANAALTKMVEELGEIGAASGDTNMEGDDGSDAGDDQSDADDGQSDADDDDDNISPTYEDLRGSCSKKKKHN